jgi:allophycocyanin-B
MSIITQSIAIADRESRYLSVGELSAIQDFLEAGQHRVGIAATLMANEQGIVYKGTQKFWERCPVTPSNSGNPVFQASCMRDQSWYLRLVTYAVIADDIEPIEKVGLKGAKEMYNSLGVPLHNLVECMQCLKEVALDLLPLDDAAEVAPYFDYIVQGLKP